MDCQTTLSCRTCPVRQKTVENALLPEDLDKVDRFRVFEEWRRGQTIFYEGTLVENHYSIYEGVVRLVRTLSDGRRAVIGFLFAGDLFGLSDGETYSYSAEAVNYSRICRFPKRKMEPMYDEHPNLKKKLVSIMIQKLNIAERRIADLARKSSEERLASFLLALDQQGSLTNDEGKLKLPMNREDISDYLGLSLETTSRTFTNLMKKGMITFSGQTNITIQDREKLTALAGEI